MNPLCLILAALAVPLYNIPDALSNQLHRASSRSVSHAVDAYGTMMILCQATLFVVQHRHHAVVPRQVPTKTALWLVLANALNCYFIAVSCLFLLQDLASGLCVDVACCACKMLLPWLFAKQFASGRARRWPLAMLGSVLLCFPCASWFATAGRTRLYAVLLGLAVHTLDTFLDEWNVRVSPTFASAQKNVLLLTLLYVLKSTYRHHGGAQAALEWGDAAVRGGALVLVLACWNPTDGLPGMPALPTPHHPPAKKNPTGHPTEHDDDDAPTTAKPMLVLQYPPAVLYPALMLGWIAKAPLFMGWHGVPVWLGVLAERVTSTLGSTVQEEARYIVRQRAPNGVQAYQYLDVVFKVLATILRSLPVLAWISVPTFFVVWIVVGAPLGIAALGYVRSMRAPPKKYA